MRKLNIILTFVLAPLFSGCAQSNYEAMQADHERQISETRQSLSNLSQRVDGLSQEVDNNNLMITSLSNSLDSVKLGLSEMKDMKAVEDAELAGAEEDILEEPVTGKEAEKEEMVAETSMAAVESPAEVPPVEDLYRKAYGFYEQGLFAEATAEFDKLISAYPDSDYTDNALYWKGEINYSMLNFEAAISDFEKVVKEFPEENKAPDAQLKIGYSYFEMQDFNKAKAALEKVVDRYPFSESAKKAEVKLNSI